MAVLCGFVGYEEIDMGGVKRLLDEEELPEPPSDAYSDFPSREIDDAWMADAAEEEQIAAIIQWFHARFCDPALSTPYNSAEGGYLWVSGGPYDANEVVHERFERMVPEPAVAKAVDYIQRDGIFEWAPTQLTYYDEAFDVYVHDATEPARRLEDRLATLQAVLSLGGDENAIESARNLVYAGTIAALETYLWETMAYWVDQEPRTVANLVTQLPLFRDRKVKLGDIFTLHEGLTTDVKAHMQHMVWHRWDEVARFLKVGLEIELPSFRKFSEPVSKRHDIVHRSGQTLNGIPIAVSGEEVRALALEISAFAHELDRRIAEQHFPF